MDAIKRKTQQSRPTPSPRGSVNFPVDLYQSFEDLAKKKKASITWAACEAAEKNFVDQYPFFTS
jgi:hypothetical protein